MTKHAARQLTYILLYASLAVLWSCAAGPKLESNSAQGKFKYAQALIEDNRYEEALIELGEIKNKHPYSRFAVLSELAIADLHFKRESFIEAQGSYELFKSLHPKHEKSDHVVFYLAMSFFNQLPSTIDRDLSVAKRALYYFKEVADKYPASEFAKKALEKSILARKMLAEKEFYIADFYFYRANYLSALGRYENALKFYPGIGFDARALFGASASSYRSGAIEKGEEYYNKLTSRFPGSDYSKKAKEEKNKYVQR